MISTAHEHILFKFKNLNKNIPVTSCLQVYSCHTIYLNILLQFTNLHVPHFCTTLWYIFNVPHFYLVNVPHFWLMYHMFQTICSMFHPRSIVLFTFLITLLCLCLYLSFIHFVLVKRTCIKLYTKYHFLKLYYKQVIFTNTLF